MPRGKHTRGKKAAEQNREDSRFVEEDVAAEAELAKQAPDKSRIAAKTLAFPMPFRAVCAAASGCGKTYWVSRYLLTHHPDVGIVWVAPEYSLRQDALKALRMHYEPQGKWWQVDGSEGWTQEVRDKIMGILKEKPRDRPLILVVDDMLSADKRSKFVSSLYCTARHLSTSVLEMAQRLFPPDKEARTQRLNCTHYWLGRFAGGRREVSSLLQQLETKERAAQLAQLYEDLCDESPFSKLIVSVQEPSNSPMRYRTELDEGIEW